MGKNTCKKAFLAAMAGSVVVFGGCLGGNFLKTVFPSAAVYIGLEFLLDNDTAGIDLFEDGAVTTPDDS